MTLIARCTRDWIGTDASSRLTRVSLRTGITVVTRTAVCLYGIRAGAGVWIAYPRVMTLIARRARDTSAAIDATTDSSVTRVVRRRGIAIIACRSISLCRIRTRTCRRIAGTCVVTLIARTADHRIAAGTHACLTRVSLRTGIPVATRSAICLYGIRARAGCRVARPRVVTLIARATCHGVGTHAGARLTAITLRTGIAVIARRAVRLRRVRAHPGCRVARPSVVTLIARCTCHWVGARAHSRLTAVALRTSIAVIT